MQDDFPGALRQILRSEGGRSDHPDDPGGRTNQGVIQRVYNGYRRNKGLSPRDVYLMSDAERDEIYRIQYWNVIQGDDLPSGVSYVVFDGAVNSGPVQSVKWLQRALGNVKVDGLMGEATKAAARAADPVRLITDICERRMAFLKELRTWKTFGNGWTKRVRDVRIVGLAFARAAVKAPTIAEPPKVNVAKPITPAAKAPIESAKPVPSSTAGDATAGAGVATGSIAIALEAARQSLQPLAGGDSTFVTYVVVALAVAGVVCTAGGAIYSLMQKRKALERADALDLPAVTA